MSKRPSLPQSPTIVTTGPQLAALVESISALPAIAVDTESNSLYAYQEQVCLLQFSLPGSDYIVDPLAGFDLSPLAHLFADPDLQKVFHAAEYDVMCLKRDFSFTFANLFDTMWAARTLGWPRVGLGSILEETFDVRTNKKYQRYNWGRRPLDAKALVYACLDTHYLLSLRDLQAEALVSKGRWEEARETFDHVAASEPAFHPFDPADFWHVKGAFDLSGREQAILRELYVWRDLQARRQDCPHFKVLHDRVLTALAQTRPRTREALVRTGGITPYHVRRYGRPILQAVKRGLETKPPHLPPPPPRHSEEEIERYEALRTWRKGVAHERGVDVDVIVGNAALWTLAESPPRSLQDLERLKDLGTWKRKTYGDAILSVLASKSTSTAR